MGSRWGMGTGVFGVGMAVAAFTVAGCASPSAVGAASPGRTPLPNTTTTAPPADASTGAAGKSLTAEQLKAGLLPESALGTGFKAVDGALKAASETQGYVTFIEDAKCVDGQIVDAMGSTAQAADSARGGLSGKDVVSQHVYQFRHGDAAQMLAGLKARTNGKCAKYNDEPAYEKPGDSVAAKATAKSGLGDQALLIEQTITVQESGTRHIAVLDVRYGDVVVGVSYEAADTARVQAYDLESQAKAIAAKLGLRMKIS